jgi:Ca2+-binding RTX toxin-like protein
MATYTGTAAANHIIGTSSGDTISGRGGNDTLEGGGGNDTIYGGGGADTLIGGTGNDLLSGGAGRDLFLFAAGDGQDRITDLGFGDTVRISGYSAAQSITQAGSDVLVKLSATDTVTFSNATVSSVKAALQFGGGTSGGTTGGTTGNTITGTNSGDTLNGTAGNDTIYGLGGYDVIHGGGGNDRIYGGLGGDALYGGAGADVFVYTSTAEAPPYGLIYTEWDTIYDFQTIDKIDLSAVDIDPLLAGKQSFHFAGYTDGVNIPDRSPGALYIAKNGDYVWIEAFLNGDGYPDLNIDIYGSDAASLSASNLIL